MTSDARQKRTHLTKRHSHLEGKEISRVNNFSEYFIAKLYSFKLENYSRSKRLPLSDSWERVGKLCFASETTESRMSVILAISPAADRIAGNAKLFSRYILGCSLSIPLHDLRLSGVEPGP